MPGVVEKTNQFDPGRWGLPAESVDEITQRFESFFRDYGNCFKSRTWDNSKYAKTYMRGLMTMENKRNYSNISRWTISFEDSGNNIQHFMSDSPWSSHPVFAKIQQDISQHPDLQGGMLSLDESGDKRSGDNSAGASRQYLGRLGKIDIGQVAVALGYYKDGIWTLVDGELYLPMDWFDEAHTELRRRWHIPDDRRFATKPKIGLEMILRAKANGLPFTGVTGDTVYGMDSSLRKTLDENEIMYVLDISSDKKVYLRKPSFAIPETPPGKKGRPFSRPQPVDGNYEVNVGSLSGHPDTAYQTIEVRQTERGVLKNDYHTRRVWTLSSEKELREEWLLIRREENGKITFSLSNLPLDTPLEQLALWRSFRYFVERVFQDSKSELGWDELEARKYRSWMHHTALTALALWFIAYMKLRLAKLYPRDPELARELEVEVLPQLSTANVRSLFKAAFPLGELTHDDALNLVVKHLFNRMSSTRSRRKNRRKAVPIFKELTKISKIS